MSAAEPPETTDAPPWPTWHGADDLRGSLLALKDLQLHKRNARRHPTKNVEAIRGSWERFGQQRALLVYTFPGDRRPTVIAGNGGAHVAGLLGWTHVAVTTFHGSAEEAEAYAIADNRTAELSRWEQDTLETAAAAMRANDSLLSLYQSLDLGRLVAQVAGEATEPALPDQTPARVQLGELWELGEHRLLCGDALEEEALGRLLGAKERAALVFTDPPYAIYGSATGLHADIADDKMVRPFFRGVVGLCARACRPFAHVYICCDWRSWASWWEVAKGTGLRPKNMIVWEKGGGLGSNYQNGHELLLYAWLMPMRRNMTQKITGGRQVNDTNIWKISRVPAASDTGGVREHNAQKPVDLVARAIANSSDKGDLVLDPFVGSGTTIVASEQAGRRCYAIEIEPANCDVTIHRWEQLTGKTARRLPASSRA